MRELENITDDIFYVGVSDGDCRLFEGQYSVHGMCYNSYVIMDEKTAVMDTVDAHFVGEWLENVAAALGGGQPDYLIVQHMEPDHSAGIAEFLHAYPDTTVVGNAKTFAMMEQFFGGEIAPRRLVVKDGETLSLGRHTLTFVFAPMVHWPEVMVTYDACDRALFSADGFGRFGTYSHEGDWADEARRYYIGIVGKYGAQVQSLLKKASALDIKMILPLHGNPLTENLGYYIHLYDLWSSYTPEEPGVAIVCASVYGNTREAADVLAHELGERGVTAVIHDLSTCDMAMAVADAFRFDRLVLATPTYNGGVFPFMRTFIDALTERSYRSRRVALIENGSWAPVACRVMRGMLEGAKDITYAANQLTIRSALTEENRETLRCMADELAAPAKAE